jgi:hypothetical protein
VAIEGQRQPAQAPLPQPPSEASPAGSFVASSTEPFQLDPMLQAKDPAPGTRGSIGVNTLFINDWSSAWPFLDQAKAAREWDSQGPLALDENGWVKELRPGQSADLYFAAYLGTPAPYVRYVVSYRGEGRIVYDLSASKDAQASKPGRDVINIVGTADGDYARLRITSTNPQNPIRDITIVPERQLARFERGEIFNPQYVARLRGFRAFRFMDWMRTNGSTQKDWADRPKLTDRSYAPKGAPIELMVKLANELHADPWFNMPHLASDDYVRRFASLVRDTLDPALTVYVEHSNEVWNWAFPQSHASLASGNKRWGDNGDSHLQWHGMRTAQMCDIWKQVFAEARQRVHCTLGIQIAWRGAEESSLDCKKYVSEGHDPCYKHIDSIAVTGYFSAGLSGDSAENRKIIETWFKLPDGGVSRALEQIKDGRHLKDDWGMRGLADAFAYYKRVVDKRGLQMLAYEAGSHITANGTEVQDDPRWVAFHLALNRAEGMYDRYMEVMQAWKTAGGTLFMHYGDIASPSRFGSWAPLEYVEQAPTPRWRALRDFNAQPCWWKGC